MFQLAPRRSLSGEEVEASRGQPRAQSSSVKRLWLRLDAHRRPSGHCSAVLHALLRVPGV